MVRSAAPRMSACGVHFTEICSGSEAGSYLRLIDLVYHSTLGLRVIKKREEFRVQRSRDFISAKVLINCLWRNQIAHTNAQLLLT